jgi:hypothetical protein
MSNLQKEIMAKGICTFKHIAASALYLTLFSQFANSILQDIATSRHETYTCAEVLSIIHQKAY